MWDTEKDEAVESFLNLELVKWKVLITLWAQFKEKEEKHATQEKIQKRFWSFQSYRSCFKMEMQIH